LAEAASELFAVSSRWFMQYWHQRADTLKIRDTKAAAGGNPWRPNCATTPVSARFDPIRRRSGRQLGFVYASNHACSEPFSELPASLQRPFASVFCLLW
jgi:hypothetical protein